VAAPIASKILAETFKIEEGEEYKVAELSPAKGSFRFVSSVDFGRSVPAAMADAPPGESTRGGEAGQTASARAAAPTVRPAADAEGTVQQKKPNFFQRLFGGGKKKEKKEKPQRPSR